MSDIKNRFRWLKRALVATPVALAVASGAAQFKINASIDKNETGDIFDQSQSMILVSDPLAQSLDQALKDESLVGVVSIGVTAVPVVYGEVSGKILAEIAKKAGWVKPKYPNPQAYRLGQSKPSDYKS